MSRAQVAAATGLTKATVSSLVNELLNCGLLAEPGVRARGEFGRPGSVLAVNATGCAGLGLEVNVDYLAVCVIDFTGQTRFHRVDVVDNRAAPEKALGRLAHMAETALHAAGAQGLLVRGMGVALPGVVDVDRGMLLHAPNLGWRDLPVRALLGAQVNLQPERVDVENEANLAALAELWFGRGAEWGDYLHVSGEIGVGAGIVSGGRIVRGSHGFAGEAGHISIDMNGPACPCGARGCLERYCGQEAILRAAGLDPTPATRTGQPDGSIADLLTALDAGRARPLRAVHRAGEALGRGLAGAVNLLDVDTVVLGGIYSSLAPWLAKPFTDSLRRNTMTTRWAPTRVEVSELGADAAVRGAAELTIHRVLADPTSLSPLITYSA
jgi:predicted NBD/HSP70 family sugar kinase